MSETSKQIETNVAEFLATINVTYNVVYRGTSKRDNCEMDSWNVTFLYNGKSFDIEYYTGLGHRVAPLPKSYNNVQSPRELARWTKENAKPVKPQAASVLHSLVLDMLALDTSFDYWCDDFGYDRDSISAFNTYQACCKIGQQMKTIFTHDGIEVLRGLLEDY